MLTVQCKCGEIYHAEDSHVGRALRCARCGAIVAIVDPHPVDRHETATVTVEDTSSVQASSTKPSFGSAWMVSGILILLVLLVLSYFSFFPKKAAESIPVSSTERSAVSTPFSLPLPVPSACPPIEHGSLPNGRAIRRSRNLSGLGRLIVDNGTELDADIRIVSGNHVLSWNYVSSHNKYAIQNVPTGLYRLVVCQGIDWSAKYKKFICNRSCFEFEKPFEFTEVSEGNRTRYDVHSITLHEVIAGNVKKRPLQNSLVDQLNTDEMDDESTEKVHP